MFEFSQVVVQGPIEIKLTLFQTMASCRRDDEPLSEAKFIDS